MPLTIRFFTVMAGNTQNRKNECTLLHKIVTNNKNRRIRKEPPRTKGTEESNLILSIFNRRIDLVRTRI